MKFVWERGNDGNYSILSLIACYVNTRKVKITGSQILSFGSKLYLVCVTDLGGDANLSLSNLYYNYVKSTKCFDFRQYVKKSIHLHEIPDFVTSMFTFYGEGSKMNIARRELILMENAQSI